MAAEHPVIACYSGLDSVGALQLGAALATALKQPLVLATAYRYEPSGLSARPLSADDNVRRHEAAEDAVRRARRLIRGAIEVREEVIPAESVPVALADLARDTSACLLALGRDLDGRVTRGLLERAPCPVAVSPFSVAMGGASPLRRVAVADDGSPTAALARTAAERLAAVTGAQLDVLTAPPGTDPGQYLVDTSEAYDLLSCGSRGRGRVLAAVLGSVSGRLVSGAHCPVLVVPPLVRHASAAPLALTTATR